MGIINAGWIGFNATDLDGSSAFEEANHKISYCNFEEAAKMQ